ARSPPARGTHRDRGKTMAGSPADPGETTPYQAPVAGVAPPASLTSETKLLRQSRLRAAALFLTAFSGVGVAWSLLVGDGLWPLHAAVGACLGVACAMLSRRDNKPV